MKRIGVLALCLMACGAPRQEEAPAPPPPREPEAAAGLQRHAFARPLMGTEFRVVLYAADAAAAARAAAAAFARLDEIEQRLSDWRPDSEVSALCASAPHVTPHPVSEDLWAVLTTARAFSALSDGAFDVTVGPYVRLWRRAGRQGELPDPERLARAAGAVGWQKVEVSASRGSLRLTAPGMRLDLGGIAKGYALDEALFVLQRHAVRRALLDGGGDLRLGAAPPERDGWRIEIEPPTAGTGDTALWLVLSECAIATSGDTQRFVEIDGARYSHIVDPRTGMALEQRVGATVIAPTAMSADALASALCVLGVDDGAALLRATGVQGRISAVEAGGPRVWQSDGFAARLIRSPRAPAGEP